MLPLDNRVLWTLAHPKPSQRRPRDDFRYFQGGAQVPEHVAVNVRNRSHLLRVEVDVPDGTVPEGALLAMGCGRIGQRRPREQAREMVLASRVRRRPRIICATFRINSRERGVQSLLRQILISRGD